MRLLACILVLATLAASVAACATPAATRTVAAGQQFTLRPGEQVRLVDAGTLRYVRVVGDSRCPPDVQCIWAGDAGIALRWLPDAGAARDLTLHTQLEPKAAMLGGWQLRLLSLDRGDAPQAQLRLDPAP